jgi:hypothetical protein
MSKKLKKIFCCNKCEEGEHSWGKCFCDCHKNTVADQNNKLCKELMAIADMNYASMQNDISEIIEEKIKRNDNPVLTPGLMYALVILENYKHG